MAYVKWIAPNGPFTLGLDLTMWFRNLGLLLVATLPATFSIAAQTPNVGVRKGDTVVVVIPSLFMSISMSAWSGNKFDINAKVADGKIVVQQPPPDTSIWRDNWRTSGFPSTRRYRVSNLKTVNKMYVKGKFIELTLDDPTGYDVRIFAPADQPEAVRAAVARAASADSVFAASYDSLAAKFFTGPLAAFSADEKNLLLRFAHLTANGTTIGHETFKDVTYLTIALPSDGATWNNLVVNQSKRLGQLIGAQLALLKAFAKVTVPHQAIGGLKLVQSSRHGTAPGYYDTKVDRVEAYFPIDAMMSFANADITSQQLVNLSIILLNGDRVEINLSQQ